ncbi:hypothetical protein BZA05DRAFT_318976, partial [Tricharina praecox]|uniref:uncharacterized protein n=1 Tax=Tricharina praecox TaxID=43433 RepID=UPI00221FE5FE
LSLEESQSLLVQLTDIYPQTTICIDGLDEVAPETRVILLKSLANIMRTAKNPLKIFATSRMDPDIPLLFHKVTMIELQPSDSVRDITRFVEEKVQSAIDDKQLLLGNAGGELKAEICNILRHRCKGMFQLAALQITFLCAMSTEEDVRRNLRMLPRTLDKAYDEIYERI